MTRTRSTQDSLAESGVAALLATCDALGIAASDLQAHGSDVEIRPGGSGVTVEVRAAAVPTMGQLHRLLADEQGPHHIVVVADQLSEALRDEIDRAGAGWLDRRGHFKLTAPGLWVDADTPAIPRRETGPATLDAIRGRSGLAAASALLLRPDHPPGPSEVARHAGLDPSSISRSLASLADVHLAERVGRGRYRPLVPELFWALADAWPRHTVAVRWKDVLGESDPLGLWRTDRSVGCALAGVRGAVAWGAPLAATADYPLHIYAPTEEMIRQAKLVNEDGRGTEVHFSVDPVGYVTADRYESIDPHWWTAHPLFCALDLAASSRDREALEQWNPPEGFTRVW